MGLYCERTGVAMIVTKDTSQHKSLRTLLERITRGNYSVPPNHGAAVANLLFSNPAPWLAELSVCRERINELRIALGEAFLALGAPSSLQAITKQKGMFSLLPLNEKQMIKLREKYAIYGMLNGRINIAGLQLTEVKYIAKALVDVLQ